MAIKKLEEIRAGEGIEFKDLTDERYREYDYGDGIVIRVKNPIGLNISKSEHHYVVDKDEVVHCIRPGWKALRWYPKKGCLHKAF